ncbi:MAG: threonine/serine exporter family protein [Anaerolineae bacterium]|nr:threonine/serine exporter family protein [Anaerolineae bacterium]
MPGLTREELNDLVDIMLDIGQLMLQSGAASFRAERTMALVGLALGAEQLEIYVTPTGMVATAICGAEQRTRTRRTGPSGVNMARIAALNSLSRYELDGATLASVRERVNVIKTQPRELPAWTTIPAVAAACGAFALILGGRAPEFLAAAAGAGLAQALRLWLHHVGMTNPFAATVLAAFGASLMAWGVDSLIAGKHIELAVIASVLLLVPGVPLVTSVIDLTNEDLVSGVTRGVLALVLALSIGIGVMLTLWITGLRILP